MIERTQEWNEGYCQGLIAAAQGLNKSSVLRGGNQASSSMGNTGNIGAKPRTTRKNTRGGSKAQHALAGHEGGLATATKRRGRRSNAESGAANQSAQS